MKKIILFVLLYIVFPISALVFAKDNIKVISSDWAIIETLTAMGHPPIGVGDKLAYNRWVKEPQLPHSSIDIGLRFQPNLELISQLNPDLVINSSWFMQLQTRAIPNAKVVTVNFSDTNGISWQRLVSQTRVLGQTIHDVKAAELLINRANHQLHLQKKALLPYNIKQYVVIQFIDARHVRIYGSNSLYGQTLIQLGLKNGWSSKTNSWGFSQIDLPKLASLPANTMLIIVQPYPVDTRASLAKSAVWQALPFHLDLNHRVLPAVWSFGALPSAMRFANLLTDSLIKQKSHSW